MIERRVQAEKQMRTGGCDGTTEVYNRVCGFFRPVKQWNIGKRAEYNDRVPYKVSE